MTIPNDATSAQVRVSFAMPAAGVTFVDEEQTIDFTSATPSTVPGSPVLRRK